jgi:hypothetical protein
VSTITVTIDDLLAEGITSSWTALNKKIDTQDFPPGRIVGRRRLWTRREVEAWIDQHTTTAIQTLVRICKSGDKDSARVAAAVALLDRGWGKPGQYHQHEGELVQHIISDRPLTDDEWRAKYCRA